LRKEQMIPIEHVDVMIVGAGLSGIGAACHLKKSCPTRSFALLESRNELGGTWDLFRYPGVRSDSDMYTLGYSFKPWERPKAIAGGESILSYLKEAVKDYGIGEAIRYEHKVIAASWDSSHARWTQAKQMTCHFLFMCAGYYSYAEGYTPEFSGINTFLGRVVHPQKWTSDVIYADKKVVVIGSGATAVTLIPELAKQAATVTMLQRSPTYMVARPSEDAWANRLRRWMPSTMANNLTRWKWVLLSMLVFRLCRNKPAKMKSLLLDGVRKALGAKYDVETHFTPKYNPWEQRLCLVPDGDLFEAVKSGRAQIVTDLIESFNPEGIQLKSGKQLDADLVVMATGLNLELLGGLKITVDGVMQDLSQAMHYKGLMYSGIPNMASTFGYTNASWTLKSDLTCQYVCRLLNHMQRRELSYCVPQNHDSSLEARPWVDFTSGYFERSQHLMPKQGSKPPWLLNQNYLKDVVSLRHGKLEDGILQFWSY
jgi:monooxygenase